MQFQFKLLKNSEIFQESNCISRRSFLKKSSDYIKLFQKRGKSEFGFEHNAAGRSFVAKRMSELLDLF